MNTQIATDPSQSKRLLDAGVDPKTADMAWGETLMGQALSILRHGWKESLGGQGYTPAWSLSALLSILPRAIHRNRNRQYTMCLKHAVPRGFVVEYEAAATYVYEGSYQATGATAVEACVRMVETLYFNGHKLNTTRYDSEP